MSELHRDPAPADPLATSRSTAYDVVIIGGGGHGLATAYYLATRHGITNVAVLEADYIASGNTGRNTTIIRANYGIPEAIRFYQHSPRAVRRASRRRPARRSSTRRRASSGSPTPRWRCGPSARACLMNPALRRRRRACVTPAELKELIPQIDLTGGGRYPVLGALAPRRRRRPPGTTGSPGRSRRARRARGVHVIQHTPVTGLLRDGEPGRRRGDGRRADRGRRRPVARPAAGSTQVAAMAGVRLPIRTHPLHAFVTNDYAQGFSTRSSPRTELACYVSPDRARPDAHRRRVRRQPSYSRQSSFDALRSYAYKITAPPAVPARSMRILRTWAGICDISADFSPIMGATGVRRLPDHDRLGDVGLQGDPGRRRGDGRADRDRPAAGADRAVLARPVPARPRPGRPGLGGDALMHWLDCPRCGRRPLDEFVFGGERRTAPSPIDRPGRRATSTRSGSSRTPTAIDDRALVPRGRLPALADGPPRHRRSTGCVEVR